jgi:peptide/nickel transport system permease protein
MIPILLGISFVVLLFIDISPGDPARIIAGSEATPEEYAQIRIDLRIDDPLPVRYFRFIAGALRGDLGKSFKSKRLVLDDILMRFKYTIRLVVISITCSVCIGIPLGIYAATHQYTWKDNAAIVTSLFCVSMPNFWFALLLIQLLAVKLRILPPAGVDRWQGWIMPSISLALGHTAVIARQMRSNMLEVVRQDYITTARAKGQSEGKVLYRHALKNALIPVVMVIGSMFGLSLGGAMISEQIYSIPGLGQYTLTGLSTRDYPVIQGSVLFQSILFSVVMLCVDIIFAFIDPRIRSQYARSKKRAKEAG